MNRKLITETNSGNRTNRRSSILPIRILAACLISCLASQLPAQTYQSQQNTTDTTLSQIATGKQSQSSSASSSSTSANNNANNLQYTASPFYMSGSLEAFRNVKRNGVPGIGGAALLPNGDMPEIVGGVRRIGFRNRVEEGDLWHIGSCTKAMTSTVIALMIQDGLLTKDTTIWDLVYNTNLFPEINLQLLDPIYQDVTIEHLMCHRSGIVLSSNVSSDTRGFENCFQNPTKLRWQTMRRVLATPHSGITGQYQYSNTGYLILGVIIERIKKKPYEQVMQEELFGPLGMTTAAFGMPSDVDLPADFDIAPSAWDHGYDGLSDNPWVMNPYNAFFNQTNRQPIGHRLFDGVVKVDNYAVEPVWNPAGGAYMSLEDMLKFADFQLTGLAGRTSLSNALLMQMQSPYSRADRVMGTTDPNYGWGWLIGFDGKTPILTHDGSYFRFYTNITIYLWEDIAVATATNVNGVEPDPNVNSVPGDDAIRELRQWIESIVR